MDRKPIAAGRFYPGTRSALEAQIEKLVDRTVTREKVIGLVCPHAGYGYSGQVAGATLSRVWFQDVFVILGPNHTGLGAPFSIMSSGNWQTPLGSVPIDSRLGKRILDNSTYLEEDFEAHREEHSIEVQLPFLQYFKKDVRIVPIMLAHADGPVYREIGQAIARAIRDYDHGVVILASSDMSHYEPQASAHSKDKKAIEAMLHLDENELLRTVARFNITMCGYGPAATLIAAAKELGATKAELVEYRTSGDATGDYRSVVGYAGILIPSP